MMQPVDDSGMIKPLVQTHKSYGLITGLALVVLSAALYVSGIKQAGWVKGLLYGTFLVGLYFNALAFSKANGNAVTFGQVFSSGFKATAIIVILIVFWTIVSTYIFPNMKEKELVMIREAMEKESKLDEDIVNELMDKTRSHFMTVKVMGSLFSYLIMGLISSLICAAVVPKNNRPLTPVV